MTKETLRAWMEKVVHAYNKHFRRDLISEMTIPVLLANMYPDEREYFEMLLRRT